MIYAMFEVNSRGEGADNLLAVATELEDLQRNVVPQLQADAMIRVDALSDGVLADFDSPPSYEGPASGFAIKPRKRR